MIGYDVLKDIGLIKELLNITDEDLSLEIGIDRTNFVGVLNKETVLSSRNVENFYSYVFKSGLNLNRIKEMFYKEEKDKNDIVLFHGSKTFIDGDISLNKSRNNSDFGKGFYCGENISQAITYISTYDKPSVYILEFNGEGLKSKIYKVDREWILSVAYFRGELDQYKDHQVIKNIIDSLKDVDYVVAPIADSRMFEIIDSFLEGMLTDEQTIHSLSATSLGSQYVFLTKNAIDKLHILERCYISEEEKNAYNEIKKNENKIWMDKAKLSRIKYKNKGLYIGEILK